MASAERQEVRGGGISQHNKIGGSNGRTQTGHNKIILAPTTCKTKELFTKLPDPIVPLK